MPVTYEDFHREPSKTHQCMHFSEEDGTRCRAHAMLNNYMCFVHRSDDIPTVIQNEPFLIERLDRRAEIQEALADVAARLAANRIDLKRAGLLAYVLQVATCNLSANTQPAISNPEPPTPNPEPATSNPEPATSNRESSAIAPALQAMAEPATNHPEPAIFPNSNAKPAAEQGAHRGTLHTSAPPGTLRVGAQKKPPRVSRQERKSPFYRRYPS